MTRSPQAKIAKQKKTLRVAMASTEPPVTFTDLALRLGHDISVISKSVNHGRFPRVLLKIKEALGVR